MQLICPFHFDMESAHHLNLSALLLPIRPLNQLLYLAILVIEYNVKKRLQLLLMLHLSYEHYDDSHNVLSNLEESQSFHFWKVNPSEKKQSNVLIYHPS